MLRFIIQREIHDGHNGLTETIFETLDIDVPDLERAIFGGGHGPTGYDHRRLIGTEQLPATQTGDKR